MYHPDPETPAINLTYIQQTRFPALFGVLETGFLEARLQNK